jgi:hypothetical protein
VDCIHLAQNKIMWWVLVNTVMILWVPWKSGNFLTSWVTSSTLSITHFCGVSYTIVFISFIGACKFTVVTLHHQPHRIKHDFLSVINFTSQLHLFTKCQFWISSPWPFFHGKIHSSLFTPLLIKQSNFLCSIILELFLVICVTSDSQISVFMSFKCCLCHSKEY